MSMRLHYAQHYDPDWQGDYFKEDFDKWDLLFREKFADNGWTDGGIAYEVNRDDLRAYIDSITDKPEEMNDYFTDYTNEQVSSDLEMILSSDDDQIHIEWN